ncbi:protein odr-4 homolog [Gordionus sp. m RMFG-2023]|uniref:protein odr-4 homolog n=1 Tax=Gordionus sp. m RMFG-2023 TaxID=3053472 RepID=UPI0031FC6E34
MFLETFIETSVKTYIYENINSTFVYGIIVGQEYSDALYIPYIAKTPEDTNAKTRKDRKNALEISEDSLYNTSWIWQHSKQANNMLPGGLDIIGIFVIGTSAFIDSNLNLFKQTLQGLVKNIQNFQIIPQNLLSSNKMLMKISTDLDKEAFINISAYHISESNQILDFTDSIKWSYKNFCTKWCQIDSNLLLDWNILLDIKINKINSTTRYTDNTTLRNQLKQGLKSFINSLNPSYSNEISDASNPKAATFLINDILLNHQSADMDKLISDYAPNLVNLENDRIKSDSKPYKQSSKNKQKDSISHSPYNKRDSFLDHDTKYDNRFIIDILTTLPFNKECSPKQFDNKYPCFLFSMNGSLAVRAYVPPNATVKQALEAFFKDITRSLSARCEIIVDEEETYEHERESKTFFETPSRVFAPLSTTGLTICDYIFRGEESCECLEPLKELLDLNIEVGQIESDVEKFSDPSEISLTPLASTMSLYENNSNTNLEKITQYTNNILPRSINYNTIMTIVLPIVLLILAYLFKKFSVLIFPPPPE